VLYAAGIALSFVSMPAAIVVYALAPAIFVLPGRLDRLWLCNRQTSSSPASSTTTTQAFLPAGQTGMSASA
jgi:hypothetical protein